MGLDEIQAAYGLLACSKKARRRPRRRYVFFVHPLRLKTNVGKLNDRMRLIRSM